jgi:hypothetical protein
MGYQMCQLLATLCVASSLALGSSNPYSGFCLQTLSFSRPLAIEGAIGDMTFVSLIVVASAMCEE